MVKIIIDLPETLNKKIGMYKIAHSLISKEIAIIEILEHFLNKHNKLIEDLLENLEEKK